jgi:pimeloyl-ACP methyl ester carboxylesterase
MPTTELQLLDDLTIPAERMGEGRPALVLHGGGGPATVANVAAHLAEAGRAVTLPTHPGWELTPRPAGLATVADYADAYLGLIEREGMGGALVVGSSLGGWIAAEMATRAKPGQIAEVALLDPVGIDVPGEEIADLSALTPEEIAEAVFWDPDAFTPDPATVTPEMQRTEESNIAALGEVGGDPYLHDPTLRERLGAVDIPTLVVWGAADDLVTPTYGRAFAAAIPGARFELIPEAGHLPHLEEPEATFEAIDIFLA